MSVKNFVTARRVAIAVSACAALLGTAAAQARSADISWSISIGHPYGSVQLVNPGYYPRYPVLVTPPHVVYHGGGYGAPRHWDRDGDGIPNRHDRLYNPRWDRDGDGVPNRYDGYDNRRRGPRR